MLDNKTITTSRFKESQIIFGHDYKILKHFNCELSKSMNLGISSLLPNEIQSRIEYFIQNYDIKNFLLSNTDVYIFDDNLNEWLSNQNAFFIIQTLGISDKKIANNVHEICYPYMFNLEYRNIFTNKDRDYGFSFLNNYPRYFRIELGYYLWKAKLLDDIFYTQSLHEQEPVVHNSSIKQNNLKEFLKLLPIQHEKGMNMEHDHTVTNPAFYNSYAHIYTESEIESPVVTEKTFKPFLSGQIPIPLACKGHLSYLKSLGFHTFDDLLGPEFDYSDSYLKMIKIKDIVKKGKRFIKEYYLENLDKIEHNNKNLKNMHSKRLENIKF